MFRVLHVGDGERTHGNTDSYTTHDPPTHGLNGSLFVASGTRGRGATEPTEPSTRMVAQGFVFCGGNGTSQIPEVEVVAASTKS